MSLRVYERETYKHYINRPARSQYGVVPLLQAWPRIPIREAAAEHGHAGDLVTVMVLLTLISSLPSYSSTMTIAASGHVLAHSQHPQHFSSSSFTRLVTTPLAL